VSRRRRRALGALPLLLAAAALAGLAARPGAARGTASGGAVRPTVGLAQPAALFPAPALPPPAAPRLPAALPAPEGRPPPAALSQPSDAGGTTSYSQVIDGTRRSWLLHVPTGGPTAPRPLVLVLPGLRNTAGTVEEASGFDAVADREGLLVVYANGLRGSWNAGTCCGYAAAAQVDDLKALRGIVDVVATRVAVDRRRVIVAGFSNGGMLGYRFACEAPGSLAGLIVVSGALVAPTCTPSLPVSIVVAHGLKDNTVPYVGQAYSAYLRSPTPGVEDSLVPFLRVAACSRYSRSSAGSWRVEIRRGCHGGTTVTVLTDAELGHAWPQANVPGGVTLAERAVELLRAGRSAVPFG
jgi:polyhydroxybutyrate depolymerase